MAAKSRLCSGNAGLPSARRWALTAALRAATRRRRATRGSRWPTRCPRRTTRTAPPAAGRPAAPAPTRPAWPDSRRATAGRPMPKCGCTRSIKSQIEPAVAVVRPPGFPAAETPPIFARPPRSTRPSSAACGSNARVLPERLARSSSARAGPRREHRLAQIAGQAPCRRRGCRPGDTTRPA